MRLKRTIPMVLFVMTMLTKLFSVPVVPFSLQGDLIEVKENDFENTAHDKTQKNQVQETSSRKNAKIHKKTVQNHILCRNLDFWKKSGIFKLELPNPFAFSCK